MEVHGKHDVDYPSLELASGVVGLLWGGQGVMKPEVIRGLSDGERVHVRTVLSA